MRMVRWMCGVKLKDRLPSKELRERLGVDDIELVLQQNRLRWYGHVVECSGISWTICKQSAPRCRQITIPTPHHSIFTAQILFLTPNQQCQSTEETEDRK